MAMDKVTRLRARHHFSGWFATAAITLSLGVLVLVAMATADVTNPTYQAVPDTSKFSMGIGTAGAASERTESPFTVVRISLDSNDEHDQQLGGPRECQPDEGIVSDCTFN